MKIFKIGRKILIGVVILTVGFFCAYRIGTIDDEGMIHYTDKRYQEDFSDELNGILNNIDDGLLALNDESSTPEVQNEVKEEFSEASVLNNAKSLNSEEQIPIVDNKNLKSTNENQGSKDNSPTILPSEEQTTKKTTTRVTTTNKKTDSTTTACTKNTTTKPVIQTTKKVTTSSITSPNSATDSSSNKTEGTYNSENAKIIREAMNKYRNELNLKSLQYDPSMQNYADIRAKEISILFGHTRPNGESSIPGPGRKYHGEILLKGGSRVARAVLAWQQSPQHNAIMIDPKYTRFAVSEYTVKTSKGTEIYRVALFA